MIQQSLIQDHYNLRAVDYDSRRPDMTPALMAWVARHWPRGTGVARAAELGCGIGHALHGLALLDPRLHLSGVDNTRGVLRIAARRVPQAHLLCADLCDPALSRRLRTVDVALSLSVMDQARDIDAHLRLLHSITRENGTVFLSCFAWTGLKHHLSAQRFGLSHRMQTGVFTPKDMRERIMRVFAGHIEAHDILRPDPAWNVQIYKLRRR